MTKAGRRGDGRGGPISDMIFPAKAIFGAYLPYMHSLSFERRIAMRALLACLCVGVPAVLAGCTSAAPSDPSTPRAIESDISAAQHSGPTAEQIGQAQMMPDVLAPHDNTVVPTVTLQLNNAY